MINKSLKIEKVNCVNDSLRVAWLLQDAGAYYQPIICEFTSLLPTTRVYTAAWLGFLPGFEDSFSVNQVGQIKVLSIPGKFKGYSPSFTYLPLNITNYLIKFKPKVIFSTAFSLWTLIAIFFKIFYRWKVIILYDGSSPGVEYKKSWLRLFLRKITTKFVDAYLTNNQAGKIYLTKVINTEVKRVFVRPYLIPHPKTYSCSLVNLKINPSLVKKPIFIVAGHVIPRKGIKELLQACSCLQKQGYINYTLLIVGDGAQRQELEAFAAENNLTDQIQWIGYVDYEQVGAYYQIADVFVFPTLEDVWGLVAVEAMMFGKPILCSKWAGAAEMVKDGENGYIFDPHQPAILAELMSKFIDNPNLISQMGAKSQEIMADHTPEAVAKSLAEVVEFVLAR
jgi:glycosyltransferase involved in cell wall biosynthesis